MYSAPMIIASLDSSVVLAEAFGQTCSQATFTLCG